MLRPPSHARLPRAATPNAASLARERIRGGGSMGINGHALSSTRLLAPGFVQANVTILPPSLAADFINLALLNPAPLPILDIATWRDGFRPPRIAPTGNVLTDVPSFKVFKHGQVIENSTRNLAPYLAPNSVAVLTGCSFSFEDDLIKQGLWHGESARNVPMYETSIDNTPSGPFGGKLVVSMRWIRKDLVPRVRALTSRHALSHGAPVDIDTSSISLERPDWGEYNAPAEPNCVPIFWACGVTALSAVRSLALVKDYANECVITHCPGQMFISDVLASQAQLP